MKLSFTFLTLTLVLAFAAAAAEEVEVREPALPGEECDSVPDCNVGSMCGLYVAMVHWPIVDSCT